MTGRCAIGTNRKHVIINRPLLLQLISTNLDEIEARRARRAHLLLAHSDARVVVLCGPTVVVIIIPCASAVTAASTMLTLWTTA